MQNKIALVGTFLVLTGTFLAYPETQEELNQRLLRRIDELERRLVQTEQDTVAVTEASKAKTTGVSLGASELSITSANSNFVFKIRGYVQADSRVFFNDRPALNDTFLLRRVRPIIEGTFYEKYDYRLMLDFGSGATSTTANKGFVQDAHVTA